MSCRIMFHCLNSNTKEITAGFPTYAGSRVLYGDSRNRVLMRRTGWLVYASRDYRLYDESEPATAEQNDILLGQSSASGR